MKVIFCPEDSSSNLVVIYPVGGISIPLLREGGVAESRGGRWIHNADNNRLTHSPTTSPYGDSSFPKEENGEYYRLSNYC